MVIEKKQIPTRMLAALRLDMARNDKVVSVCELRARSLSLLVKTQAFGMTMIYQEKSRFLRASSRLCGSAWLGMTTFIK
jgi:hypothetical protein